jgi:V/A-type H+-transporting ATPase subunit G/H
MTSKILEEIKKTEERAARAIDEAQAEKQRIIMQAKQQSVKRIAEASAEIQTEREDILSAQRKEIEAARQEMMTRGLADIKALTDKSRSRVPKAAQFVLSEFEKSL